MRTYLLALVGAVALALGLSLIAGAGPVPDQDGDGVPDTADNCILVANAPPNDCDNDGDGFGNACDGDFNQDGVSNAADVPALAAALGAGTDPGNGTDMNCDGVVNAADIPAFAAQLGVGTPGPSAFAP